MRSGQAGGKYRQTPMGGASVFGTVNVPGTKGKTLNRKGKVRRNRRNNTLGKKPDTKRAIVTLAEGDSIQIFET